VVVPQDSCTRLGCSPRAGEDPVGCCVVETLFCLAHPSDPFCGSAASPGGPAALIGRAVASAGRYFGTVDDLARLYVLRARLRKTPGGRGAVALYETHQAELKRLLVADPGLRERAIDVLTAWRPLVDAVIEIDDAPARVTATQVAELESFLGELRPAASPALRAAIDRERAAIGLGGIAGLSAEQALARLGKLTCVADATTLCLAAGRMRVEAAWETRQGARGQGRATALTADTGTFWFFDAANVEAIVKVVDACTLNDRRWFFAAGLTDVRVVTTVTDTATGAVKTYTNPQGRRFAPVQDTEAFDCTP
jgi:hypothetical protein